MKSAICQKGLFLYNAEGMRRISYVALFFSLCLGGYVGNKIYNWYEYAQKPLKIPLLEKEFIGKDDIEESPIFIALSLKDDHTGLKRTLQSIKCQTYKNIQVFILGDNPSTIQRDLVEEFEAEAPFPVSHLYGAYANLQRELHSRILSLEKETLIVPLDSRHFLSNSFVLKTLNITKIKTGKKLFFGQYIRYPSYEQGIANKKIKKQIKRGKFPADTRFLDSFKAISSELVSINMDIFALNHYKTLLQLFNERKKELFFCPHVMWIVNDLPPGDEVIFDGPQTL